MLVFCGSRLFDQGFGRCLRLNEWGGDGVYWCKVRGVLLLKMYFAIACEARDALNACARHHRSRLGDLQLPDTESSAQDDHLVTDHR